MRHLTLLFWNLEWPDRKKILMNLGGMPEPKTDTVPHFVEKIFFNKIKADELETAIRKIENKKKKRKR